MSGDDSGDGRGVWGAEHWSRGLALHLAVALGASADDARALCREQPAAIRLEDCHYGRLPLHWAAAHAAPLDAVDDVLHAHRLGAQAAGKLGMLPLHWAVAEKLPVEATEALLLGHPKGVLQHDDNTGGVALHYATDAGIAGALLRVNPEAAMLADIHPPGVSRCRSSPRTQGSTTSVASGALMRGEEAPFPTWLP